MDTAFNTAAFPGFTTAELNERIARHEAGQMAVAADVAVKMKREIERRERVAQGDTSAMTDGERLRFFVTGKGR